MRYALLALSLLVSFSSVRADVEVDATLRGVNLWHLLAGERPNDAPKSALPLVTVPNGKEAVIRVVREFPYVAQYDSRGVPQTFQTAYLGTALYIRATSTPAGILYSGRLELAENVAKPQARTPQILQATSAFQGTAALGKTVKVPVVTPHGKKTTLQLRFSTPTQSPTPAPSPAPTPAR